MVSLFFSGRIVFAFDKFQADWESNSNIAEKSGFSNRFSENPKKNAFRGVADRLWSRFLFRTEIEQREHREKPVFIEVQQADLHAGTA